ncbi:MAG: ABC transporter permease, partial [Myxococcales bacterium]|nr:ABC transporter permease [Myxococcales bacterium]
HELDRRGIAELHAGDTAIWPLIRCGPRSDCNAGASAPPTLAHPLGTDAAGRDIFARVIYGGRHALGLALAALLLAASLGVSMGALAGALGGVWDELLARPVELVQTFPAIIVVAVVQAVFPDAGGWALVLAVGAVRWAEVARHVRATVLRVQAEPHVLASRALGAGRMRILTRHVLPEALPAVVVSLMFGAMSVILLEVAVAFLGLGSDASWGGLIAQGLDGTAPRGAMAAAAFVAISVIAVYLVADSLESAVRARVATTTPEWRSG